MAFFSIPPSFRPLLLTPSSPPLTPTPRSRRKWRFPASIGYSLGALPLTMADMPQECSLLFYCGCQFQGQLLWTCAYLPPPLIFCSSLAISLRPVFPPTTVSANSSTTAQPGVSGCLVWHIGLFNLSDCRAIFLVGDFLEDRGSREASVCFCCPGVCLRHTAQSHISLAAILQRVPR